MILLGSEVRWVCPNCTAQLLTPTVPPKPILHPCPGLQGLLAPMVREGTDCKIEAVEREDYIGSELVVTDSAGRPVMNVTTTRDDGQDVTVFAPTARGET